MSSRPLDDGEPIEPDETAEGLAMVGTPVIQYGLPGQQVIETEAGYETVETPGWVKFLASFRNNTLKKLRGAKLAVFLSIGLHVNDHGQSFPGIATIAKETGYSKGEVMETVTELENIPGLLLVDRKQGRKNIYTPSFVAYGKRKPVGETPTTFDKAVGVKPETGRAYPHSKKSEEEVKNAANAANDLFPPRSTPIPDSPKRTTEERRASTAAALERGLNGHISLVAAIESAFHIQPLNWDTKTNRAALHRLRERGATPEQVEQVKRAWDATNGRNGYVPSVSQIVEFWPSAFVKSKELETVTVYE